MTFAAQSFRPCSRVAEDQGFNSYGDMKLPGGCYALVSRIKSACCGCFLEGCWMGRDENCATYRVYCMTFRKCLKVVQMAFLRQRRDAREMECSVASLLGRDASDRQAHAQGGIVGRVSGWGLLQQSDRSSQQEEMFKRCRFADVLYYGSGW